MLAYGALAKIDATETGTSLTIKNDRLLASVDKANGAINALTLDGQNLLGTQSGSTGIMYLDCYWYVCLKQPKHDLCAV